MSSQVVRVQSFGKGSLGAIGKEVEREEKDHMEHRNEDIDLNRTHMNEFYKQTQNGMYGEWKDICKDLNIVNADKLRKNATAFEGMVITSDKEHFEKLGYVPGQDPPEKVKEFFDKSYEFAKQEIGFKGTDKNVLSAVVHYDETTPHLQLYYVPVVDEWKEKVYEKDENGKVLKNAKGSPIQARDEHGKLEWNTVKNSEERKLSRDSFWKNKGGNQSYSQMQDRYYEQISKEYGLGRGEKGSTREHTTKAQWQAKELDKEIATKEKDLVKHELKLEKIKDNLEYAKDGSVLVPQLATKQKTAEIQDQNRALRLEVRQLIEDNQSLQAEIEKLRTKEQERVNALKDRNSIERRSLDALDKEKMYQNFLSLAKEKAPNLYKNLQAFERNCQKAHDFGKTLVEHKQGYVECRESRKLALESIQEVQARKSTLESNLSEIRAIERPLNDTRNRLADLEQERGEYTTLQFLKKRECDKQITECKDTIKGYENTLETKFDMKGQTDEYSITVEADWHEKEISKCKSDINDKSEYADRMSSQAEEHIREYKTMLKTKNVLKGGEKGIVERYDKEYAPPREYRMDLDPYNSRGMTKGRNKNQELKRSMNDWKELIDKQKAETMLKPKEPRKNSFSKTKDWTPSRE